MVVTMKPTQYTANFDEQHVINRKGRQLVPIAAISPDSRSSMVWTLNCPRDILSSLRNLHYGSY